MNLRRLWTCPWFTTGSASGGTGRRASMWWSTTRCFAPATTGVARTRVRATPGDPSWQRSTAGGPWWASCQPDTRVPRGVSRASTTKYPSHQTGSATLSDREKWTYCESVVNVRLNEPPPTDGRGENKRSEEMQICTESRMRYTWFFCMRITPRQKKNAFPKLKVHLKKVCYSAKHCKKSAVIFGSNLQKKQKWLEIRCDSPWNNIQTLVNRQKECIIYYQ